VADLSTRVFGRGQGRSPIMPAPQTLSVALLQGERVKVYADTVTRTWNDTGDTAFNASPDHATVVRYHARLRVYGDSTVIDTEPLGKPTPDGNGVIVVPLAGFLAYRPAGTYTISILAVDAVGSADSDESPPFTLPLPWPTERIRVTDGPVNATRV